MSGAVQRLFHWWITLPWSVWLDQTNKLTQILAVVAGGLGALLKFGIGAEVFITGSPFQGRGSRYLIVTTRFKNTGAVKLYLQQRGTAIIISVLNDIPTNQVIQVSWTDLSMFPVFEPHEWINASETLEDVIALKAPSDRVAVQLHLRAVTKTPAYLGGLNVEWNSKRIVELPDVLDSDPPPATLS